MANEYIRKSFDGGVVRTTVSGTLGAGDTSITLADGSSFPSTNFVIVIDRGQATEEKILVASRSSNTLTVTQRGYDGSSAAAHTTGAYVEHVVDSYVLDQANAMSTTMTTAGDMIYKTTTGENTAFSSLSIGTSEYVLKSNGSTPTWGQLQTAGVSNNCITEAKLHPSVAGNGLLGGNGTALYVNVAPSGGLEISGDAVQIKALGVTNAMLTANAVTSDKIAVETIVNADISLTAGIEYSKLSFSNNIVAGDIAPNAIGSSELADSAVDTAAIATGAVTTAKLSTTAGEIAGSWDSWTPTYTNVTNGGGTYRYMKIGKTLYVRGGFGSGMESNNAGTVSISLPSGMTADSVIQPIQAARRTGVTGMLDAYVPSSGTTIVFTLNTGGDNYPSNYDISGTRFNGVIELA